ncbi:MAG: DUF1499 domain-containing protein [Deltaproteobacteria bacterium]|nr:DUF1499 domain-containing protein [Deltaproteobacteria bacterium]
MEEKMGGGMGAYSYLALAGLVLALACGGAELLAGYGVRAGFWDYRLGISLFRWAAYGGVAAGLISLAGCLATRPGLGHPGFVWAMIGLVIATATAGVPWSMQRVAREVPAIHDITTDPADPPGFVALLRIRRTTANGGEYGGPEIAVQQRKAYPDIAPLELSVAPPEAFNEALLAARRLGWELVASDPETGIIEATATTFWFGFKDDVIVRVRPSAQGSRIDIRSVSRVGRSDLGANARRIRKFVQTVRGHGNS